MSWGRGGNLGASAALNPNRKYFGWFAGRTATGWDFGGKAIPYIPSNLASLICRHPTTLVGGGAIPGMSTALGREALNPKFPPLLLRRTPPSKTGLAVRSVRDDLTALGMVE